MTIDVVLYPDRRKLGHVAWGPTAEEACECYAKADNGAAAKHGNPSRDPVRPYGDTPTGTYRCHVVAPGAQAKASERKYGPHGYISMDPVAGRALEAKKNGRWGLLIHGGDLNRVGELRPTFGCIRLRNEDMARLMAAVAALGDEGRRMLGCEVRELTDPSGTGTSNPRTRG